jgi:iron complex outermembrane recepter protein
MRIAYMSCRQKTGAVVLLCSTALAVPTSAMSQAVTGQADSAQTGAEIIVTAQKRAESAQNVPIAMTAFGSRQLEQLQVQKFEDYARYLTSVSFQNTSGPGTEKVYFRGISSGENANPSSSLPTVGIYLDEMPITTIAGALDVHMYDIARVEALAGPQGTIYGAASEAGTIRIITNKPDTRKFSAGFDTEINNIAHGDVGYVQEGFVNVPLTPSIALRVVGWNVKDAGYIDNRPETYTFINSGIQFNNNAYVKDNYNPVDTYGGRVALKVDLDSNWTVTPQIMAQRQIAHGSFGVKSGFGDLETAHFEPERTNDAWYQATLLLEGKIGSWDVTYAGGYLKRKVDTVADYTDYEYAYEWYFPGWDTQFYDNNGNLINPTWQIHNTDRYTKQSHEFRVTSPSDRWIKMIGGFFLQRQTHYILNNFTIPGLASSLVVPGTTDNIWTTAQNRIDRDLALFGEVTVDIAKGLSATAGTRYYKYNNTLIGFAGFGGFYPSPGTGTCFAPSQVAAAPCTNVDGQAKGNGWLHKFNLTYKFDTNALIYATVSRGFRPGGVNRRPSIPAYAADFIENYEAGWKTSWLNRKLYFNGAIYQENWNNFQISTLGASGITDIRNAGNARVRGFELEVTAKPVAGLTITGSSSFNDAKLLTPYCADNDGCAPGNAVLAPAGTRLPLTPELKTNVVVRYEFPIGTNSGFIQAGLIHESSRSSDLRTIQNNIKGIFAPYAMVDLSAGIHRGRWKAEIFSTNLFDKRAYSSASTQCQETVCGDPAHIIPNGPMIYRTPMQPREIGLKIGVDY